MSVSTSKKINLGSGRDYLSGWINVDIVDDFKIDVKADLSKPFPFNENSIDEILASDILEHFTKEDGIAFLKNCLLILKPQGRITIRTHNISQIIKQFEDDPEVMIHFIYGNTEETGVFGAHKYAYTKKEIRILLTFLGFQNITIEQEETNFLIKATKASGLVEKSLTIAVIQQTPDLGGAETYMLSLIAEFQKNNSTVFLATNNEKFSNAAKQLSLVQYHIPVILDIIGNWKGLIKAIYYLPFAIVFYTQLLWKLKKKSTDVLLMSGFSEKLLVSTLSVIFRIPVVWIEYGRLETIFKRNFYLPKILYRILKHIPEKIIIPTDNTKQSMITAARISLAKLVTIPCGTQKMLLRKNNKRKSQFKGKFVIGNISRLTREKGQDVLINAFPLILKEIPTAHLLLVGGGPDKQYFESLIAKLHLQQSVTITGFVSDVHEYYDQMDIFVFPSVWELEGFGVVSIEAMMHSLPIVASEMAPIPEIITHEKEGLLFPPGDKKALADAVILLAKNVSKQKEMGERGYKKAVQQYAITSVAQRMITELKKAVISYSVK